jgi:hypothetical protein
LDDLPQPAPYMQAEIKHKAMDETLTKLELLTAKAFNTV